MCDVSRIPFPLTGDFHPDTLIQIAFSQESVVTVSPVSFNF